LSEALGWILQLAPAGRESVVSRDSTTSGGDVSTEFLESPKTPSPRVLGGLKRRAKNKGVTQTGNKQRTSLPRKGKNVFLLVVLFSLSYI
jgi:hypothetical protein